MQITQDCCIGIHMPWWFAASIPHHLYSVFLLMLSLINPTPRCPSPISPQQTLVCDAPFPVSMCYHCSSPAMSENMWCLIFCSCVSLLRMMVSRFIHVPIKNMNSLFFMAAWYSMVYMCHIFPVQSDRKSVV